MSESLLEQHPIQSREWKEETDARRDSLNQFLAKYLSAELHERPRYDNITGLHFSGQNSHVMREIVAGHANPLDVEVLYADDKITQIHVVFDSKDKGHNIDVYLAENALRDYLVAAGETAV